MDGIVRLFGWCICIMLVFRLVSIILVCGFGLILLSLMIFILVRGFLVVIVIIDFFLFLIFGCVMFWWLC